MGSVMGTPVGRPALEGPGSHASFIAPTSTLKAPAVSRRSGARGPAGRSPGSARGCLSPAEVSMRDVNRECLAARLKELSEWADYIHLSLSMDRPFERGKVGLL